MKFEGLKQLSPEEVAKIEREKDIETKIHYEQAIPENGLFGYFAYKADNLVNVHKVKNKVLSLPIHPWLTNEEVNYVIEKINEFYNN